MNAIFSSFPADNPRLTVVHGHEDHVSSICHSPDGTWIASGSWDHTVRLWEAKRGRERTVLRGHTAPVTSVAFSPDGRRITSGSRDKTVRAWDVETGNLLHCLSGHANGVRLVCFSPDGTRILGVAHDKPAMRLWNADSGVETASLEQKFDAAVWSVSFSPDGTKVCGALDDFLVRVWDAATGEEFAFADRWMPPGPEIRAWTNGEPMKRHEDAVCDVAFSPDGRVIASGSIDKTVRCWDLESAEPLHCLHGHDDGVDSVSYSPDGKRIASLSLDEIIRVWDAETGECLEVIQGAGDIRAIAAGPPRFPWRLLRRGTESVIEDSATGRTLARFPERLFHISTHPSGCRWMGSIGAFGIQLGLVTLETSR